MDPKDLLKMLDREGKPPDAPAGSGVLPTTPSVETPADASPTALEVDAWGLRRGCAGVDAGEADDAGFGVGGVELSRGVASKRD